MDMLRYLGMGLLGAVTLASTASAQSRWDGADDLPVSPLACGEGGPAEVAAKPYDGGQRRARRTSRASRSRPWTCRS